MYRTGGADESQSFYAINIYIRYERALAIRLRGEPRPVADRRNRGRAAL
jgi:hypothetical protein